MEKSNVKNVPLVTSYYWSDVSKLMKTYHETKNYEKLNGAVKVISPFLSKILGHFEPYAEVSTKIKSDKSSSLEHFVLELSMYFNLKLESTNQILTSYLNNRFCDDLNNLEKKIVIPEQRMALKNSIRIFLESERMVFLKIFKTIIEYAVFERKEFSNCNINDVKGPTIDCIISLIKNLAAKDDPVPDNILKELSQLFECLCLFSLKESLQLNASDINRILVAYNQLIESPGITRNHQYSSLRNSFNSFAICCAQKLTLADTVDVSRILIDLNSDVTEFRLLSIIMEFAQPSSYNLDKPSRTNYELSTSFQALSDTLKQYQSQDDFCSYLYSKTYDLMVDIFDTSDRHSYDVYTKCLTISKTLLTIKFEINSKSLNHFWYDLSKCLQYNLNFISDFIDITISILRKNEELAATMILFMCNIRMCDLLFLENFRVVFEKVMETHLLDFEDLFVSQWKFLNCLIENSNANGYKIVRQLILPNIVTILQQCPVIVEQVYDTLFRAILDQQFLDAINRDMLIELIPYVSRVHDFDTLSPKLSLFDTYIAKDFDISNSNCSFSSQLLLNYLTFLLNVMKKRQSRMLHAHHIIKNGIKFIFFTVIPKILTLSNIKIDYSSNLMKKIIIVFSHLLLVKYKRNTENDDQLESLKPYVIKNIFESNFFAICVRILTPQSNLDFLSFIDNNNNNIRYSDPKIMLMEIFFEFFITIMQYNSIGLHFIHLDQQLLMLSKEIDNRDIVFELFSLTCHCVSINLRWLTLSFFRKLNDLKFGSVLKYFGSCKPNKVAHIYRLLLSKVETVQLKCEILLFLNECYDKNNNLFQTMFIVDQGVLPQKPSMLNPLPVTNPKNALITFLQRILIRDCKKSESIVQYFTNPIDRYLLYELCARLLRSLWFNEQAYLLEHLYDDDFWTVLTKLLFESKDICLKYVSSALHIFDILSLEFEKGLLNQPDKKNARDILSQLFDNDYFHYLKWLEIFSEQQFVESIEKIDDSKLLKIDQDIQKLLMNIYCTYSKLFNEHVLKFLINSLSKGVNVRFRFYECPNNNVVYFKIFESFLRIAFRNHSKVIDLIDIENLKSLLSNIKIYFSTLSITYRQCVYDTFYNLMSDDMQTPIVDILVGLIQLFAEELTVFHQFSAENTVLSVKKSTIYSLLSVINMNLMKHDTYNQLISKEILNVFIENIWILVEKIYQKVEYVDLIHLVCITLSLIKMETLSIIKISKLKYLKRFIVPSQSCLNFLTNATSNDLVTEQFQQWSYQLIAVNNLLISFIDSTQEYGAKVALNFVQSQSNYYKRYLDLYNFKMDTLIVNTNTSILMLLNEIVKHVEPMRWLETYGLFGRSILHSVEFYSILIANPNHVINIIQKNNNETRAEFFDRLKLHGNRLLIYMNLGVTYLLVLFRNNMMMSMDTDTSCLDSSFDKIVTDSILNLISVIEIIEKNSDFQHLEFLNLLQNTGRIDNKCLRLDLLHQKLENEKIFAKEQFVDNIQKYSSIDKEILCDLDFNLIFSIFTQMLFLLHANMSFIDNMLSLNAQHNFTKLKSFIEKLKTKYESCSFNDSKERSLIENLSFVGYAFFSILNRSRDD